MSSVLTVPIDSTSRTELRAWAKPDAQKANSSFRSYLSVTIGANSLQIEVPVIEDELPEYMTEAELEAFLVENGVFDKVISQLAQTPRSTNWEAELDEL